MTVSHSPRRAGRPRNEDTSAAVLAVVRRLVKEKGFDGVSVNLVASEANVAKQTLYRRWPSKAELVLDAYLESAGQFDTSAYEGLVPTLTKFLAGVFRHLEADGAAIRNLIAAAQSDSEFLTRFNDRFVVPRAERVKNLLAQAVEAEELPAETNLDVATDMIHGAFWYRLLTGQPLNRRYAESLAAQIGMLAGAEE
ncbi:TetR/AcrR family transcriptional regulator [Pandoraea sp. ISTKB]|uniref:TetR/AcrR family transcriptional regulator n=1 Tax=Pandoraea sp. ISTKB TaxID=1586708 RepID=UPI0008468274|nr:TetR/AcrR family transcriptional regulator [Pandoraea sp. ISTKB]ODP34479.1 hypothetical protein A9762_14950 [Pandoraea sp. ISTKB]